MSFYRNGVLICGCYLRCRGHDYHKAEATRIQHELESLGPEFADDGPVRTILQERIAEERARSKRRGS